MVVTTGTALCIAIDIYGIADSTHVAAYVEMSVANTNLYRLCKVVVPTNRSIYVIGSCSRDCQQASLTCWTLLWRAWLGRNQHSRAATYSQDVAKLYYELVRLLRTRPLSPTYKQRIGACPIALESAVFNE